MDFLKLPVGAKSCALVGNAIIAKADYKSGEETILYKELGKFRLR